MTFEIKESYKTAVISTSHLDKADSVLLTNASYNAVTGSGRNWIHECEYGYIIHPCSDTSRWKKSLREEGISWPTIENIEKVIGAGYQCIHFDCDADIVDGLQSWDW